MRQLRKAAGYTEQRAAKALGWSQSKLSRMERGLVELKPADVAALRYLCANPGVRFLDASPRPASFREEPAQYIAHGAVRTALEAWLRHEGLVAHPVGDDDGMPVYMVVPRDDLRVPAPTPGLARYLAELVGRAFEAGDDDRQP